MADKDRAQCHSMGRDLRVTLSVMGAQLLSQPLLPTAGLNGPPVPVFIINWRER
jgi:hypothetical protein